MNSDQTAPTRSATGPHDFFISYSRGADLRLAHALQLALGRIAKPWYRRQALRVFRDDSHAPVSDEAWGTFRKALDASHLLLLLAHPDAAKPGGWVTREIAHWRHTNPEKRPAIVWTGGQIQWAKDDFDWGTTDALPRCLEGWYTEEPLYLDLREEADEMRAARHGRRTVVRLARTRSFQEKVARVAASAHGLSADDLIGESRRQQRRTWSMVFAAAAVLVVLGGVLTGILRVQWAADETDRLRRRGYLLLGIHGYSEASADFRAALELTPHDADAAAGLVLIALERGDQTAAQTVAARYLSGIDGYDAFVKFLKKKQNLNAGDQDAEILLRDISRQPATPPGMFLKAMSVRNAAGYFNLLGTEAGDPGLVQSFDLLTQAIEMSEDARAHYHFRRAYVAELTGRAHLIERCVRSLQILWPDDPSALMVCGTVVEDVDTARAESFLRRAIDLAPNNALAHNLLGSLLGRKGQLVAAEQMFEAAEKIAPTEAMYPANRALTAIDGGRGDEAIPHLRRALRIDPRYYRAHRLLAGILGRDVSGRDEAIALLRQAVTADDRDHEAWNDLGSLLNRSGDTDAALDAFRRASELVLSDPLYYQNLGRVHVKRREWEPAIKAFRRALSLDPKNLFYVDDLGLTLENAGQTKSAIEVFEAALKQEASDDEQRDIPALIRQRLVHLYQKAGRPREAVRLAREALGKIEDKQIRRSLSGPLALQAADLGDFEAAFQLAEAKLSATLSLEDATASERFHDYLLHARISDLHRVSASALDAQERADEATLVRTQALSILEPLVAQDPDDAGSQRRLAAIHLDLAASYDRRNLHREAFASFKAALDPARILLPQKRLYWTEQIAGIQSALSENFAHFGDIDQAVKARLDAIQRRAEAIALAPDRSDLSRLLAEDHRSVAEWLRAKGRTDDALPHYRAMLEANELDQSLQADPAWRGHVAVTHGRIGDILMETDPQAALEHYRKQLALKERIDGKDAAGMRDLSIAHERISIAHESLGDLDGALKSALDALSLNESVLRVAAENERARHDVALGSSRVADLHMTRREPGAATYRFGEALRLYHGLSGVGRAHPTVREVDDRHRLAELLAGKRAADTAVDQLRLAYGWIEFEKPEKAARCFESAFEDPKLRGDVFGGHLYAAARMAALAAGDGGDLWREHALEWLREDVEARRAALHDAGEKTQKTLRESILWAQTDRAFDTLRDHANFRRIFDHGGESHARGPALPNPIHRDSTC